MRIAVGLRQNEREFRHSKRRRALLDFDAFVGRKTSLEKDRKTTGTRKTSVDGRRATSCQQHGRVPSTHRPSRRIVNPSVNDKRTENDRRPLDHSIVD